MIEYKFKEEEEVLRHYADKMKNREARRILENRGAANGREAETLSAFYWDMLDVMAEDGGKGIEVLEDEGFEPWAEYIFHSLNGYFVSNGYESEWDRD